MKTLLTVLVFVSAMTTGFSAQALSEVRCNGYVYFDSGTMQGNMEALIVQQDDGSWMWNDFMDAGFSLSEDDTRIELRTYSSFLSCSGADVTYDRTTKTMEFRYKYNSGYLGGGCQKTKGVFTNCREK